MLIVLFKIPDLVFMLKFVRIYLVEYLLRVKIIAGNEIKISGIKLNFEPPIENTLDSK